MEGEPFCVMISSGDTTWTVPAGKRAVFSANGLSFGGPNYHTQINIDGVGACGLAGNNTGPASVKPLTAGPGAVVSAVSSPGGNQVGLVGALYDVP